VVNESHPINLRSVRVSIIKGGMLRLFSKRLKRVGSQAQTIVIASPWITDNSSDNNVIEYIGRMVKKWGTPTYVFTRPPDLAAHLSAINLLKECPTLELIYNRHLHAKVYSCVAPHPYGFAMLGSANLTRGSEYLYEIGLIVLSGGGGDEIVKELSDFGLSYLRTRPESQVVKRMKYRR
jgi:hypothetical protein